MYRHAVSPSLTERSNQQRLNAAVLLLLEYLATKQGLPTMLSTEQGGDHSSPDKTSPEPPNSGGSSFLGS